jgi:hypothetical protein
MSGSGGEVEQGRQDWRVVIQKELQYRDNPNGSDLIRVLNEH